MKSQQPTFNCITTLPEAKKIWTIFVPQTNIYYSWDFRYTFFKYFDHELRFYVGYINDKPIGLLATQYDKEWGGLDFFGGEYMEDNKVYILPEFEEHMPLFFQQLKDPAWLEDITGDDAFTTSLEFDDYKYVVAVDSVQNSVDYIEQHFHGKSKKNLKRELRILQEQTIEIEENNLQDIELLFELSEQSLGEDSYFLDHHKKDIYRDLLHIPAELHIFSYIINGKKSAVSVSFKHADTYTFLCTASDKTHAMNLGKFVILHNIETAIKTKSKLFDANLGDCNWKTHWGLQKNAQYTYRNQ